MIPSNYYEDIFPIIVTRESNPLPNPFRGYMPIALGGMALLAMVTILSQWRRPREETLPSTTGTAALPAAVHNMNLVIYALLAVTAAVAFPLLTSGDRYWGHFVAVLVLEALVVCLTALSLQVTSRYVVQLRATAHPTRITAMGSYFLLIFQALVTSVLVITIVEHFTGSSKNSKQEWALFLILLPMAVGGIVGATRLGAWTRTLSAYAGVSLGFAVLLYFLFK